MKKPFNIFKFVGCSVLLLPIAFVLYIWAALAYIAYWPIPPVPVISTEYSIQDIGKVPEGITPRYYGTNPYFYGFNFANQSQLSTDGYYDTLFLDKCAAANKAFALQYGISHNEYSPGRLQYGVVDFNLQNHALMTDRNWHWQLWRDGKATTVSKGVSGYSWKADAVRFHKMNNKDEVIGNAFMGTGTASSGGFSSPHGRNIGLLWHGDSAQPQDLNSLIDDQSGWYLHQSLDINDNGQILCIAHQAGTRNPEDYKINELRFVVLTPLK